MNNKPHREAGKGDAPRKNQDSAAYAEGWDRIFSDRKKEEQEAKDLDKMLDWYDDTIEGDTELCYCDRNNIGEPGVSCGDCPTRDYK